MADADEAKRTEKRVDNTAILSTIGIDKIGANANRERDAWLYMMNPSTPCGVYYSSIPTIWTVMSRLRNKVRPRHVLSMYQ